MSTLGKKLDASFEAVQLGGYFDPELAYWIPKYLLLRGTSSFSDLTLSSPALRELAVEQDLIGWRRLTEGKICRLFLAK